MKEVLYDRYCEKCIHKNESEDSDACFDCLNEPARENSHKPIKFKEKSYADKKRS